MRQCSIQSFLVIRLVILFGVWSNDKRKYDTEKKKKEKKSRKATIVHNTDTQLERSQESGYTGHYVLGVSTMNDVCEKRAGC